ncbi:MAG: CBS domain-containing protein [Myxococcota bacterium]
MSTVREVLDQKGHDVVTVHPDDSVYDAIKTMADQDIGAVMVVENGKPVGIVSERNYARSVYLKGRSSPETPVRIIMEVDFAYARPDQTDEECLRIMSAKSTRHLPIFDGPDLVGLVSILDVVKSIVAEQALTIEQLEQYIHRG